MWKSHGVLTIDRGTILQGDKKSLEDNLILLHIETSGQHLVNHKPDGPSCFYDNLSIF